jgi:hypothetical protein
MGIQLHSIKPVWTKLCIHPKAVDLPEWSPYNYVLGNPLSFTDPGGEIPYPITIRSFAPFDSFGGGFHGDGNNRGFTLGDATARIHQTINFDTDKTTLKSNVWSSPSAHNMLPGSITGTPSVAISSFSIKDAGTSKVFDFATHANGSNPYIPGSSKIDFFSDFSITEAKGSLSISGKLTGDNFPSTEAFITDLNGQKIFIGVGSYEGSPFSKLEGENTRAITDFDFKITTDKKGNFTGVTQGDKTYSIGDWNAAFEAQDPHENADTAD